MQRAIRFDERVVDTAIDRQIDMGVFKALGVFDDGLAVPESSVPGRGAEHAVDTGFVFASTRRTMWFCISTKNMLPALSKRTS